MTRPARNTLPHEIPFGIDSAQEVYFITICCAPRGKDQLARGETADAVFDTIRYRNEQAIWFVRFALLMPDHLHLLMSFPDTGKTVTTIISKWKEWTAKTIGIRWQRDFFEHRLRHDESYREKAEYIWANPVRAGLVANAADWPFVFIDDGQR